MLPVLCACPVALLRCCLLSCINRWHTAKQPGRPCMLTFHSTCVAPAVQCNIAACLSGSQEIAELAHCIDNIAQVVWCT